MARECGECEAEGAAPRLERAVRDLQQARVRCSQARLAEQAASGAVLLLYVASVYAPDPLSMWLAMGVIIAFVLAVWLGRRQSRAVAAERTAVDEVLQIAGTCAGWVDRMLPVLEESASRSLLRWATDLDGRVHVVWPTDGSDTNGEPHGS